MLLTDKVERGRTGLCLVPGILVYQYCEGRYLRPVHTEYLVRYYIGTHSWYSILGLVFDPRGR